MKMIKLLLGCACLLSVVAISCRKDSSSDSSAGARMSVYLTDDPSYYDAVYIDIRDVQYKFSADASDTGWVSLNPGRSGLYNLLNFRNGYDTLLATSNVPSTRINQIRLVLGSNSTVVYKGVSYPLSTPSAMQSGLKLNVQADLTPNVDYRLWLDFDAARSIVQTGNGQFTLKPVIRTFTAAISGAIKGAVTPLNSTAWVYAIMNTADTVGAAIPDGTNGSFMIRGLNTGSYRLAFKGMNNYRDTTKTGVNVLVGSVTDIGTFQLKQ